jgi:hypothetical protein
VKIFGVLKKRIASRKLENLVVDMRRVMIMMDEADFENSSIALENGRKKRNTKKGRQMAILLKKNIMGTLEKRIAIKMNGMIISMG